MARTATMVAVAVYDMVVIYLFIMSSRGDQYHGFLGLDPMKKMSTKPLASGYFLLTELLDMVIFHSKLVNYQRVSHLQVIPAMAAMLDLKMLGPLGSNQNPSNIYGKLKKMQTGNNKFTGNSEENRGFPIPELFFKSMIPSNHQDSERFFLRFF